MGLDYSDARPSYFNLFTEPRTPRRMFENIGLESSWGCKRMHAIGEQQSKRTQSGSSSRSGRDREQQLKQTQAASVQQQLKRAQSGSAAGRGRKRGAAVEAMQSGSGAARSGRKRRAIAEADAIGGQADAIREQQLCTESCPAPDYSR